MLYIVGMGYSHAKIEVDNNFLEDLGVDSSAEWIIDKIGVEKRTVSLPLKYIKETKNEDPREAAKVAVATTTSLGVEAARNAIERAGIDASQIGMVTTNCCTPVALGQSEAQRIAAELGIKAPAYDVFSACPSFAIQTHFIDNFKEEAVPDYVLCISTCTMTQKVNYNERSDGAIWGDGAAAWIVSSRKPGKIKVLDTTFDTDCTRAHAVVVDRFGHFKQDGRAVRDFSVRQTVRLIRALEEKHSLDWTKDIFIGHQANYTMLQQITSNRKIPDSNHWYNVVGLGNQAGGGAPSVLAMKWDELKKGQRIVIAVLGAGLSWGSVLMEVQ